MTLEEQRDEELCVYWNTEKKKKKKRLNLETYKKLREAESASWHIVFSDIFNEEERDAAHKVVNSIMDLIYLIGQNDKRSQYER